MRRARLEIIKGQIFEVFNHRDDKIYSVADLSSLYQEHAGIWRLPASTSLNKFIQFLILKGPLTRYQLKFRYQPTTLFCWGPLNLIELAMHIRPQCYLSHRSALQFHTLIDDPATTTIYVNDEQSPKRRSTSMLQQSAIDAAFRRPARVSNNVVMLGETQVYQLSGMHTGKLGVIPHVIPGIPIPVRVTSIERTLIDCTVRPSYAGGVASVLQAYRRAADRVDVQKLFKMLQNINYVYPYHQSIGFYLEHSRSYSLAANAIFQQTPRDYDFYLDNEITNPAYSAVWRIMYPQHLELPSMR